MLDTRLQTELLRYAPSLSEREFETVAAHLRILSGTPSLSEFIKATFPFPLDEWQQTLCARLQKLAYQTGQRILIHAPPQAGKSILVSQRLPAWLIGCNPATRIKLACHNIHHATRFSKINRGLMTDPFYADLFPNIGARLVSDLQEEWTTAARASVRDGQPSFMALGLRTGFVGQGANTLIIDDPYASPDEAFSEKINDWVWQFWTSAAKVRLREDSNVVVMFHRYHCDDLAGRMYAEGGWEMLRFAAEADENTEMPDPMERAPGELLSPRLTPAFIAEQKKIPSIWLGQFQGLPVPIGGGIFKRAWFGPYSRLPDLVEVWTLWDTALKADEQNDETASLVMGLGSDGNLYILRVSHGHWETPDVAKFLVRQAEWLLRLYGERYKGDFVEDKVSGTTLMQYVRRSNPRLALIGVSADTDKVARAQGVTPIVEAGRVLLPDTTVYPQAIAWLQPFLQQVTTFPFAALDDMTDCLVYALKRFLGTLRITRSRRGKAGGFIG